MSLFPEGNGPLITRFAPTLGVPPGLGALEIMLLQTGR